MKRIAWGLAALGVVAGTAAAYAVGGIPVPTAPVGPPTYTVNVDDASGDPGYVFYTTGFSPAAVGLSVPATDPVTSVVEPSCNVIAEKTGQVVYKYCAPQDQAVADFRTQVYRGQKVLTWWQGSDEGGHGAGADYIADDHYDVIRKIELPAGYSADVHEFRLTPDGRALITCYKQETEDLSSIGGPTNAQMNDTIAFVVDVATGKVLSQWSAFAHIPLTDTRARRPLPGQTTYDPYHMNSISLDPQGNLLISFRNLSAIYDVDIRTGKINWSLGGAAPTLKADAGVEFAFQHDAEFVNPTTIQFFNDNAAGENDPNDPAQLVQGLSSVQQVRLDLPAHQAFLVNNWTHPDDLVAIAMGNAQTLPNGHTFVSWGSAPRLSEFDAQGRLVYDASLPSPSYRGFLDTWPGQVVRTAMPQWFVASWSARKTATSVGTTTLTAEGQRAAARVAYRWYVGGRLVSSARSLGKVLAAWKGKPLKAVVTVSAAGLDDLTRTVALGTLR